MHYVKKYKLAFTIIMSTLMSGLMSFVVTMMNLGFDAGLGWPWIKAWLFSILIALPAMLILTPLVEWLTKHTVRPPA